MSGRRGLPVGLWRRLQRAVKAQGGCCATHQCEGTPVLVARTARHDDRAFCQACFDRRRFGAPLRAQSWRDAGARAAREVRAGVRPPTTNPAREPGPPTIDLDAIVERDVDALIAFHGGTREKWFLLVSTMAMRAMARRERLLAHAAMARADFEDARVAIERARAALELAREAARGFAARPCSERPQAKRETHANDPSRQPVEAR